jgi:hypothetical protein
VTATGLSNVTLCHPASVSPVNVANARRWPAAFQTLPMCVPVFAADL